MAPKTTLSRREFVRDTGGLLIGFSLADSGIVPQLLAAASPESFATPFSEPVGRVAANR